jgi:tRNA(fMet)-specific endonuclease VapC
MPKYLLDTNACIGIRQHLKARPPQDAARLAQHQRLAQRFAALPASELAMSLITLGELRFGAEKSPDPVASHAQIDSLLALVPCLGLAEPVARHYGTLREQLRRSGQPIGPQDLWIAAHALAENLTVVTQNVGEFARVPGLRVEDWTAA